MYPANKDSKLTNKLKLPSVFRQDSNRNESFSEHDFNYHHLNNDSDLSSSIDQKNNTLINLDDQQLPDSNTESARNSFIYVNKNGFAVENTVSPPTKTVSKQTTKSHVSSNEPIICKDFLVEMSKLEVENKYVSGFMQPNLPNRNVTLEENDGRSFDNSLISDNSLVSREPNGEVVINTTMTVQEQSILITNDHIKYINLFNILCCWCFPFTGIPGIFFARLTKNYYNTRDLVNAKKYLKRSEWALILTFFFGFTLIAIGFAILETYLFRDERVDHSTFYHSPK